MDFVFLRSLRSMGFLLKFVVLAVLVARDVRCLSFVSSLPKPARQTLTSLSSIYSTPSIYDASFSLRSYPDESLFLHTVREIYGGKPVVGRPKYLDCGCGPNRHLESLSDIADGTGLDKNPSVVEYANRVNDFAKCQVGDAEDFGGRWDAVWFLLNGLGHCDLSKFSRCCGRGLKEGGVVIVEGWSSRAIEALKGADYAGAGFGKWDVYLEKDDYVDIARTDVLVDGARCAEDGVNLDVEYAVVKGFDEESRTVGVKLSVLVTSGTFAKTLASSYVLNVYEEGDIDEAMSSNGLQRVWDAGNGDGGFDNLEGEPEEEGGRFVYIYRKEERKS